MHNLLATYNESDRKHYMMVIAHMANVDEQMTSEEVFVLREMCTRYVLGPDARGEVMGATAMTADDLAPTLASLADTDLRYSLLLDLWAMAYADGKVVEHEEQEIRRATESLHITPEHAAAIAAFAKVVHDSHGAGPNSAARTVEAALEALEAAGVPREGLAMSVTLWRNQPHLLAAI